MNKENIPVITDREELYDKCENMEQLFDKYYLPLLDKHYSKTYELQQENKTNKTIIEKQVKRIYELEQEKENLTSLVNNCQNEIRKLKQLNQIIYIDKFEHTLEELKKWLEEWIENEEYCYLAINDKDKCRKEVYKEVLDKIKELEEGVK